MTGRASHNSPARDPRGTGSPRRQAALFLVLGLAFLVAGFLLLDHFPDTELGRTIDAAFTLLTDPESWVR